MFAQLVMNQSGHFAHTKDGREHLVTVLSTITNGHMKIAHFEWQGSRYTVQVGVRNPLWMPGSCREIEEFVKKAKGGDA
jgi:hypothetical protein